MTARTVSITDWRIRDEDLPDTLPGWKCERRITPQKHSILRQIAVRPLKLERLRIGNVSFIPFEICGEDGDLRIYRLAVTEEVVKRLTSCGAQVVSPNTIRVPAGMDVCLILRNDRPTPAKPRVSLLVQEEEVP